MEADRRRPLQPGTPIVVAPCGKPFTSELQENQFFAITPSGQIKTRGGLCLDVGGRKGQDLDPIILSQCNNSPTQKWIYLTGGPFQGIGGKCIDVLGKPETAMPGTGLALWPCRGTTNQAWRWSN